MSFWLAEIGWLAEKGDPALLHLNIILIWFKAMLFQAFGFVTYSLGFIYSPYIPSLVSKKDEENNTRVP